MWSAKPTIIVKKLSEGRYTWLLFLSNNRKKPTCVSPTVYEDAFKARSRAKEFAAKFKGPLRLVDKENKSDEILFIDETRPGFIDDESTDDELESVAQC
jgi:hypothetical protein